MLDLCTTIRIRDLCLLHNCQHAMNFNIRKCTMCFMPGERSTTYTKTEEKTEEKPSNPEV